MKRCELCKGRAQIRCASDQASLCWDCDAKVHSANFLVARHSRKLLCRICQGPTPWSAAGAKLEPSASACELCVDRKTRTDDEEEVVVVVPRSPPPESSSSIEEAASGGEAVVLGKRVRACNDEDESSSSSLNNFTPPLPAEVSSLYGRRSQKIRRTESGRVDACGSRDLDSMKRFQRAESDSGRAEFYTFL